MVKISNDRLKRLILDKAKTSDQDIIVGPQIGEDAAIIRVGSKYLAVHSDPITGSINDIGWLSINVPANDIATRGIMPRWFVLTLILPLGFSDESLGRIMDQVWDALSEIGGALIGGHTEYSGEVHYPLTATTVMGVGDSYISTSGLRPGHLIVATKFAAMEATAIAARDMEKELIQRGVNPLMISRAAALIRKTSIVKEALIAAKYASSMHDPTEGGVIQGLIEMASASNTCIDIEGSIPVLKETSDVLGALGIDAYRSLSSGMLLIGVPPSLIDSLINELTTAGIPARLIGKAKACSKPSVNMGDHSISADSFVEDDLIRVMDEARKLSHAFS
ncbi:MAG: AIR synthase family protein [Thermocladium sp.]